MRGLGAIVVERLNADRYRAYCPLFPDCEAVATSEAAAREAVERAVEQLLQSREPSTDIKAHSRSINPIDSLFERLRSQGRKAFIPFLTAGDPDLASTLRLVRRVAGQGASLIEIGFPYSDPIADGPVVQASYTRALQRGIKLDDILNGVKAMGSTLPESGEAPPLVCMTSYALVHRRGLEQFISQASAAGFSGAIVPDLPVEEADEFGQLAEVSNFKLIQLVTPTTPRDRAVRIAKSSTGFLYYVSVTGITGERDRLPESLVEQLGWLRGQASVPICVGFGISKPEHVRQVRDVADGVIVGSALVRHLERSGARPFAEIEADIVGLVQSLSAALDAP